MFVNSTHQMPISIGQFVTTNSPPFIEQNFKIHIHVSMYWIFLKIGTNGTSQKPVVLRGRRFQISNLMVKSDGGDIPTSRSITIQKPERTLPLAFANPSVAAGRARHLRSIWIAHLWRGPIASFSRPQCSWCEPQGSAASTLRAVDLLGCALRASHDVYRGGKPSRVSGFAPRCFRDHAVACVAGMYISRHRMSASELQCVSFVESLKVFRLSVSFWEC